MTGSDLTLDEDGFQAVTTVVCVVPCPDHTCNIDGPVRDVQTGFGLLYSSTCSICGQVAFNGWDVWE